MWSLSRLPKASLLFISAILAEPSFSAMSSSSTACNNSSVSSSSVSSQPVSTLSCSVDVTSEWNGNYQVNVKVSNAGTSATSNWKVVLDVPAGESIASAWNAEKISQDQNAYTYGNLSWNGMIAPQGLANFGATLTHSGATHGKPTCRIYSPNTNRPPHASFRAVVDESTVHAQIVEATDPDGDKLSYTINFGDGKIIHYQDAWHTYKTPGTYTITYIVKDGKTSFSSTQDVTVTAPTIDRAPVAIFSYISSNLNVQMNARASADPEGNPLNFSWEFSDGTSSNGTDRVTKASPNGGMLATLTVFDGKLGDTVQVYTQAHCNGHVDVGPHPQFTATVTGNTVTLDASTSTLADSLNWDFGDGTTGSGMFTSHTYASPGTYTIQLRAIGGMLGAIKSTTVVVGSTTNQPPVGDFTAAVNGATVHIQSTGVSDVDGDKISYVLDFGDGQSVKYPSAWHTYKTPGSYTITQTLNDGKVSSVKTHQVTVTAPGTNRAPVAVFSYYSSDLRVGVKGGGSADFEGSPLTFAWDFGDGPLPGADIKHHTVTVPDGGTFVTLTVFDGELGDTVQVQVPARAGQHWDVRPDALFTAKVTGKNVAVDASASKLADSFSWDFGDGTKGTGMYASHTYAMPGNYVVKLNTNGGMMGNSNSTTVVINNDTQNLPPIVELTCHGGMSYFDDFVTHVPTQRYDLWCNADKSVDPEGMRLRYSIEWNEVIEYSTTGQFHRSYRHSPGQLPITVRVDDGINIAVKKITFYPFGQPPVAELECKELHAVADNFTTGIAADKYVTVCDASKSSDPDGKPLTYEISWGDGLVEKSPNGKFTHSYSQGGNYELTLRVNDGVENSYKKLNWVASSSGTTVPPTTCEFHVTNEWSTGFTGWVRVKNNSENIVNGWRVNLAFSGSNRISNFWNAAANGSNPYELTNLSWNSDIDAGAYIEVGFNGVKNGGTMETPTLSGSSCGH